MALTCVIFFFFQAEDGIRDKLVTGVQTCALPISRLPPIVVSWEIETLRGRLAAAQRGEAFLLQGGDCAEAFADCESDTIAKKLKILLQMSLVLLHGLKKPIIRDRKSTRLNSSH